MAYDSATDRVYLVTPRARQIGGEPCLSSVLELPEPVDLAVIAALLLLVGNLLGDALLYLTAPRVAGERRPRSQPAGVLTLARRWRFQAGLHSRNDRRVRLSVSD